MANKIKMYALANLNKIKKGGTLEVPDEAAARFYEHAQLATRHEPPSPEDMERPAPEDPPPDDDDDDDVTSQPRRKRRTYRRRDMVADKP